MTGSAPAGAPLLIVRFGSLGDVVLTFAAGAALARARPDRPIHYLVKSEYAEMVRAQPWVGEVLPLAAEERDLAGAGAWRGLLRSRRWEAVLDLQDNPRSRWLTAGLGASLVRWKREGLERRVWVWSRPLRGLGVRPKPVRPAWRRYLDAAQRVGAVGEEPPTVHLPDSAAARLDPWWRARWGEREVIALAPAAAWATKEWPEAHSRALLRLLIADGFGVCVVSKEEERRRLAGLAADVDASPAAGWWTGSLLEVGAALARTRLVVAPDSGLLHLAVALGRPAVAIFGSTVPELGFAPASASAEVIQRDLACRPCDVHGKPRCPLGHHHCLRDISPATVRQSAHALRERSR